MQKQTQTYAEKVRQEERGPTRGPPFVWAYQGLLKSLQQRGNAVGTRTVQSISSYWARLEPLGRPKIWDEVRFCRLDTTCKADVKRITLRSTRANKGRAQLRTSSTHSTGTRAPDISRRSPQDLKIKVKAFLVERGKQAARRATTQCRESTYNALQSLTHKDQSEVASEGRPSSQGLTV